jgi:hypothetical protein
MMRFRTPSKNGVPGVPGVPQTLKATALVASSGGTPFCFSWNTWCSTQKRCSTHKAPQMEHLKSAIPGCRPRALRLLRNLWIARALNYLRGVGVADAL